MGRVSTALVLACAVIGVPRPAAGHDSPAAVYELLDPAPASPVVSGYGEVVAVDGAFVAVAASGADAPVANNAGVVHLFHVSDGSYARQLTAPAPRDSGRFGAAIAMSNGLIAVGSPGAVMGMDGFSKGRVYVYEAATGVLLHTLQSTEPEENVGTFGASVGIDGDLVVAGDPFVDIDDSRGAIDAGAAYVFDLTTGTMVQRLTLSGLESSTRFGSPLAIEGQLVVVGTVGSGLGMVARVYDALSGEMLHELRQDGDPATSGFGNSVAIGGGRVAVGGFVVAEGMEGDVVVVFDAGDGSALYEMRPVRRTCDGGAAGFGRSGLAIDGGTLLVGADRGTGTNPDLIGNTGTVHGYDAAAQTRLGRFHPDVGAAQDLFGAAVAVSGDHAVIGAPGADAHGADAGAVFLYRVSELRPRVDLHCDGCVDSVDLGIFLSQWGQFAESDFNGDGVVNAQDLASLLASWGCD